MGGAAEKWRPGRGRRPGWGAHAGGGGGGAGGGQVPGGSGGPGGGGRAAAAAPRAPPGASGLGLRLRGPDSSRSNLRLRCSSSWRCCRRRCCSCCHSPRPGPGRRQLWTRPWPRLHLRGGVARPRRAGRAGGQRGRSSQAREERSRPPCCQRQVPAAAAADSALTLMLRGAPAPGGASLPAPSPSHRDSWPGDSPVRHPGFVCWPRHHRCTSQIRGEAGRLPPPSRASLPGCRPCWDARALSACSGRRVAVRNRRLHSERLFIFFCNNAVPLSNLTTPRELAGVSSVESRYPGVLQGNDRVSDNGFQLRVKPELKIYHKRFSLFCRRFTLKRLFLDLTFNHTILGREPQASDETPALPNTLISALSYSEQGA
uniref:5E5 antigen-like isoform X2 n=1 Tax=Panthera onca TaxID=9690 RepID=UPI0029539F82|nr:5E5 antigen-like isoform X2 [Panthera onca]